MTDFLLDKGTGTLNIKLFSSKLYQPNTVVSQPIFTMGKQLAPTYYDNDFVISNSYNYEKDIGKIFVTHDSMIYPLEGDEEISFSGNKIMKKFKLNKPTMEFQLELLIMKKYNLELLND